MQRASEADRPLKNIGEIDRHSREPAVEIETLECALAEERRAVERLKNRRAKDLERLTELTRSRDFLEGRLAAEAAKVAKALEKISEKDKLLGEIDQRLGGARLLAKSGAEDSTEKLAGQTRFDGAVDYLWWRYTVRAARRAQKAGRLIEAQILFDAALVKRETGRLWNQLGHILRERKLFDAAETAYERALEFEPNNAETIFLAGYCAEMAGRKMQAAKQYEAALVKDPKLESRYDHLRGFSARLFG
jgi:tetratricopeptide (TPR) repeat protein